MNCRHYGISLADIVGCFHYVCTICYWFAVRFLVFSSSFFCVCRFYFVKSLDLVVRQAWYTNPKRKFVFFFGISSVSLLFRIGHTLYEFAPTTTNSRKLHFSLYFLIYFFCRKFCFCLECFSPSIQMSRNVRAFLCRSHTLFCRSEQRKKNTHWLLSVFQPPVKKWAKSLQFYAIRIL